jgi:serine protease Do
MLNGSRRASFALMTAGLAATVGLLVGLVLAGNMTPAPAVSAEPPPRPLPRVVAAPLPTTPPVSFADVAERVNPAVVTVNASARGESVSTGRRPGGLDPIDPMFRGPDRERRGPRRGAGAGFLVDADGHLLTNHHVVEGAERITVRLASGQMLPATLVGTDPETDIALLRVRADRRLPAVVLGDSDTLRVGEWVVAIGNPLAYEHTVTAGVVSFLGRKLFDSSLDRYIQTDAAINLGNSGGPLINTRGEVIGINAAISSRAPTIGFAIPINQAKGILPQLMAGGRVARGYVGVALRDVDPDLQDALNLPSTTGAVVQDVTPGSPGERAGLRPYDVIAAVDGAAVTTGDELIAMVSAKRPGEIVTLRLTRDGRDTSALVKLAERPTRSRDEDAAPAGGSNIRPGVPRLGLSVRALDGDVARRLGTPSDVKGVVVWRVDTVGAGADADIDRGDVILEIDRHAVETLDDYERLVKGARPGQILTIYLYKTASGQRRLSTIRVDER